LKHTILLAAIAASTSLANAQSPIFAFDVRTNRFVSTDTADFVGNQTVISPLPTPSFAIDFDATATNLWIFQNPPAGTPPQYGTADITTGVFNTLGTVTGPATATGMTADPDGVTWWVSENVAATMNLWRGDITTGTFTLVGNSGGIGGIIIDIACDRNGNLFGHSITTDSFYSIDRMSGATTLIGPHGLAANFAQGMDFDWSSNILYATIYTGGGTGQFCSVDTTTGAVVQIQSTQPTNGEYEIAFQVPLPTSTGLGVSYCGPAVSNTSGGPAVLTAAGSNVAANNNVTLTAASMPANQFGFFLTSQMQGLVMNPGGSNGNLCLGGTIGRYVGAGQIMNSGAGGTFSLGLNLTQTPAGAVFVAITAGQTWNFQAWFRDIGPMGQPQSNFTDGRSILFQ